MKKSSLTFLVFLSSYCAYAQNTFPSTGSVGVNTLSPQFILDVKGNSGFKADVTLYGDDNGGDSNASSPNLIFQGTNYAGASMISAPFETTYGRRGFAFSTHSDASNTRNLVERFRITYLGNVGINTATPQFKLDVNGNAGYKGDVNLYGSVAGGDSNADSPNLIFEGTNVAGASMISAPRESTYGRRGFALSTHSDASDTRNLVERFRVTYLGNVGINTTVPEFKLDVNGNSGYRGDVNLYGSVDGGDSNTDSPNLIFEGTSIAGASMISAPRESTYGRRGVIISTHSDASDTRNLVERFRITYLGNVGIGTSTPDAKLAVNGTIHSTAVKVDLTGWPDYVFKPGYNLPALAEVKTYIDKNNHLPDMPSEQEVSRNGINLGGMISVQTKKIEELTLYLIEKDRELIEMKKVNQNAQVKNDQQDARIAALEKEIFTLIGSRNK